MTENKELICINCPMVLSKCAVSLFLKNVVISLLRLYEKLFSPAISTSRSRQLCFNVVSVRPTIIRFWLIGALLAICTHLNREIYVLPERTAPSRMLMRCAGASRNACCFCEKTLLHSISGFTRSRFCFIGGMERSRMFNESLFFSMVSVAPFFFQV